MAIEQKHQDGATPSNSAAAVGSDPGAAHNVGGKGDFGIAAHDPVLRDKEPVIQGRPAGSAPGYSGSKGVRTTGVGTGGGEPGHGSGGDVDPDFNGFGSTGAIAAKPVGHDELTGADVTDGTRDKFASGGPAAGRNTLPRGSHGTAPGFKGDVVDHTGTDASTVNADAAGSVTPPAGNEIPGAEGEITMEEATGDVDQGAET